MSLLGIEEKVARVRIALITACKAKGAEIMALHANKKAEEVPKNDLGRAQVLFDIAGILENLVLPK